MKITRFLRTIWKLAIGEKHNDANLNNLVKSSPTKYLVAKIGVDTTANEPQKVLGGEDGLRFVPGIFPLFSLRP